MIGGLAAMAVANAGVFLASHALVRRIRSGKTSLDLALVLVIRLVLISAIVIVFGLAQILNPWGLGIAGAILLLALLLAGEHRALPQWRRPALDPLAALFLGAVLVRLLLQVWFVAPYAGDTLSYHLPKIAEWVQAGGFTREHGADDRSTFPAGFELVETWWVIFLHHDVLIEMAGVEFFLLALAASHALAIEMGLLPRTAMLGALAAACTPGMLLQATSCLNDAPVAALWIATATFIVARHHPAIVALPVLLGVGVKPTYGYAFSGLALLAWFWRRKPLAADSPRNIRFSLAGVAFAVGSFWYVRNWILFGNPVYPVTSAGFLLPDGDVLQLAGPHLGSLRDNLRRLVDSRISDQGLAWSSWSQMTSGWGPLVFSCGLTALVVVSRADSKWRSLTGAFLLSVATVLVWVRSDPWYVRFILFFPTLPALAAAKLCEEVRGLKILLACCLVVQFVGTLVPGEWPIEQAQSFVRQDWRDRRSPPMVVDMPREKVLGCLAPGGRHVYQLYGPDFSTRVITFRVKNADELLEAMRKEGIQTLYASYRSEVLAEALTRRLLEPLIGAFYRRR